MHTHSHTHSLTHTLTHTHTHTHSHTHTHTHTHTDPDTGETALHVAVSLNHETIVHQLLMLGAGLTMRDKEGLTPVMTACHYGHIQSLEQIATKGIHPSSELCFFSYTTLFFSPSISLV